MYVVVDRYLERSYLAALRDFVGFAGRERLVLLPWPTLRQCARPLPGWNTFRTDSRAILESKNTLENAVILMSWTLLTIVHHPAAAPGGWKRATVGRAPDPEVPVGLGSLFQAARRVVEALLSLGGVTPFRISSN